MEVLKTTSPETRPVAPKELPSKTVPSSRARIARCGVMGMDSRIGKLAEGGKRVNAPALLMVLLLGSTGHAQETSLREVTPSTILEPGRWEAKVFSSVYTQTE